MRSVRYAVLIGTAVVSVGTCVHAGSVVSRAATLQPPSAARLPTVLRTFPYAVRGSDVHSETRQFVAGRVGRITYIDTFKLRETREIPVPQGGTPTDLAVDGRTGRVFLVDTTGLGFAALERDGSLIASHPSQPGHLYKSVTVNSGAGKVYTVQTRFNPFLPPSLIVEIISAETGEVLVTRAGVPEWTDRPVVDGRDRTYWFQDGKWGDFSVYDAKTDEHLVTLGSWGAAPSQNEPIVFLRRLGRAYALGYENLWDGPGLVRVFDPGRLEELDPIRLSDLGDISWGIQQIAADQRTNRLFITTEDQSPWGSPSVVIVVDAGTGEVLSVIEPAAPIDVFDIEIDSRHGLGYLLAHEYGEPLKVMVFSTRVHEVVGEVEVGDWATEMQLDPVSSRLFVKGSSYLTVIGLPVFCTAEVNL